MRYVSFSAHSALRAGRHHLPARLGVLSKRLLHDDPVLARLGVDILLETLGDDGEDGRGEGHVEDAVAGGLAARSLVLELLEVLAEVLEPFVGVVLPRNVRRDLFQPGELFVKRLCERGVVFVLPDVLCLTAVKLVEVHLYGGSARGSAWSLTGPGVANDVDVLGEVTLLVEGKEGWESLLLCEVAGCAEDDNDRLLCECVPGGFHGRDGPALGV
jgi:hypothetical protein